MRDFVNVKDIVQANLLALHKSGMDYGTFNVGTGKPTSILDVANVLIKLYGSEVKPTIIGGYREGDIRHCYADIKRIKKHGYKPTVSLTDGMRELVEWGEKTSAQDTVDQAQRILKEKGLVK
jgi:dTDP-L-rhamnose 4-epimerase